MSTITTIQSTDLITNSRSDVNSNFSALNTDKMETSVLDTDTALAANSDAKVPSQKAVKTYIDTSGGANASTSVRGIVEEATNAEITTGTATGGTGARLFVNPSSVIGSRLSRFGGTGADGALSVTSGTTTIDCANAAVVTKNYTSISITGGKLAFSNPHANGTLIILRSQGNVTGTSGTVPALDGSGMGAAAGSYGNNNFGSRINLGTSGQSDASPQTNAAGGLSLSATTTFVINPMPLLACGGGGGTGGTSTGSNFTSSGGGGASLINSGTNGTSANHAAGTGGAGGRGGGAIYIECGGAYNCTSTVSVAGNAGSAGTGSNGDGGGGGGGGTIIVRYNTLTVDSGTYTVTGGAAGGKTGTGNVGGVGGDGQSSVSANTFFV